MKWKDLNPAKVAELKEGLRWTRVDPSGPSSQLYNQLQEDNFQGNLVDGALISRIFIEFDNNRRIPCFQHPKTKNNVKKITHLLEEILGKCMISDRKTKDNSHGARF
jgi:hypothetical protein